MHFSLSTYIFPCVFFLFTSGFLRTFVIVTYFSLTILIFIISVTTFSFVHKCAYIAVGNFHSIKIHIVQIQVIFFNVIKIPYIPVNEPEHFWETFTLGYYVPNRIKYLVQCCTCTFLRWLVDFFAALINVNYPFSYIQGLFLLLIRCT